MPLRQRYKFRDWNRLLPRPAGISDQERFIYLFEFIRHVKGSSKAKAKAFAEMEHLSKTRANG